jgi:hypothetical protein
MSAPAWIVRPARCAFGSVIAPGALARVITRDGVQRAATITAHPDTFSSVPARVSVNARGKRCTVSGFAWLDREGVARFTGTGRNADLIPLTRHKPLAPLLRDLRRRLGVAEADGLRFACGAFAFDLAAALHVRGERVPDYRPGANAWGDVHPWTRATLRRLSVPTLRGLLALAWRFHKWGER